MPPRYAYWTIIIGDQPTAFRAGALEDIMPTFNRLKEKQPAAKLMWFQSGKLWPSRIDAREAMQMRGERGRDRDPRQQRDSSDRKPVDRKPVASGFSRSKPEWKPKSFSSPKPQAPSRERSERNDRPEWKPKAPFKSNREQARSTWKPKPYTEPFDSARPRSGVAQDKRREERPVASGFSRTEKPEWKPRGSAGTSKPAWKPKSRGERPVASGFSRTEKPEWKPRGSAGTSKPAWKPKSRGERPVASGFSRTEKPEWKPKGSSPHSSPQAPKPSSPAEGKRKWVPKAEYKKSQGIEAKKDDKWRPGGEHKDPKQKYKDAKKAKWTRFKQAIRSRAGKKRNPEG